MGSENGILGSELSQVEQFSIMPRSRVALGVSG